MCVVLLVFTGSYVKAQQYPWPVGAEPALTANFGELRANHYHMGLDARTMQRENLPIYSIDDGYISRIKVEPWGYGRAIYINHPNGVTSLYAHLNDFYPELEQWVTQQQYLAESWEMDIEVPRNMFPVKRKQFIANSGNAGGSMGPHLHLELRDTKTEVVLNPLLYGFSVTDKIAPDIIRLAVYNRNISTYDQVPRYVVLKKTPQGYVADNFTVGFDKVSFGITSYDRYTGSTNQNGIYKAELIHNGKEQTKFIMDSIRYTDTRYLNAHIDYRTKLAGGPYIQHLSRLPGHLNSVYKGGDGVIELSDGEWHSIQIKVSDPVGNTSNLSFKIKSTGNAAALNRDNIFRPGQINVFENEDVRFFLKENDLYDAFNFKYTKINGATGVVHQLHTGLVPVHNYFTVNIRNTTIPDTGKVIMHYYYGSRKRYAKATYKNGWYSAAFRELGNFTLIYDTVPPVISAITKTATRITFTITDNTEDLKKFRATINGKWVRFSYDKGKYFVYKIDKNVVQGENELIVTVEDMAGNQSTKKLLFTH